MDVDINPDIIKATQISLGKYVKRPPLTDKLLKKPPFRFLHDIITSILKNTGFFNGLFEEEELISDNVKDRESKILFLSKVISVVGTTTGKSLTTVKPSKIVAGQEPQKTNELLQSIALALDNKLSSDDAVKLYKESIKSHNKPNERKGKDTSAKSVKKGSDANKLTSKSSEKLPKHDKTSINTVKLRQKENTIIKKEPPAKKVPQISKSINKKGGDKNKQDTKGVITVGNKINSLNVTEVAEGSIDPEPSADNKKLNQSTDVIPQSIPGTNNIEKDKEHIGDEQEETKIKYIDSNLSVNDEQLIHQEKPGESQEKLEHEETEKKYNSEVLAVVTENEAFLKEDEKDSNEKNVNELQKVQSNFDNKIVKVHSIDENIALIKTDINNGESKVVITNEKRPQSIRPPSSRPGAPRIREKHESIITTTDNVVVGKVNIISENTTKEEEEETSIIIVNKDSTETKDQEDLLSFDKHGHLVQQILEAQKEFSEVTGKTNIEWQFGAQKARDVLNQEIEQIRFNVQALSRVSNPLGKLLDHVQEDVEIMRQELQQWTQSHDEASKQLLKQKAFNEESLLPLHTKLKHLEVDIIEKRDKINDLKIGIHKNATRIKKLLTKGNVHIL